MYLLILNDFKLVHNVSQTATNINKTAGEGFTCNQTLL